jgi:hypothetical protein
MMAFFNSRFDWFCMGFCEWSKNDHILLIPQPCQSTHSGIGVGRWGSPEILKPRSKSIFSPASRMYTRCLPNLKMSLEFIRLVLLLLQIVSVFV